MDVEFLYSTTMTLQLCIVKDDSKKRTTYIEEYVRSHVKVAITSIHKEFASWPDDPRVVVVQHQGKSLLTEGLPVQISLQVVHFGLHRRIGCQEEVWVPPEQVAQIS